MNNQIYVKLIFNNIIYVLYIFIIIQLCIFSTYKIIYLFSLSILIIYIFFKKNYFLFLLILPSLKNFIFYFYINNFNKNLLITYTVKNQVKKNLYMIHINKNIYNNIINDDNVFLYSKNPKKFFVYYKAKIYIINKNILKELEIYETYQTNYFKFIAYLYKRIMIFEKYNFILGNLLLGMKYQLEMNEEKKEINHIYKLFKKTGTWHFLCVGGLHINIIKSIFYIIFIFFIEMFYNPLKILKFIKYVEMIFISIYSVIIISNSYSVPIMRAFIFLLLHYLFYKKKIIVNSLYILLITIWIFLFINTNYIYNIGFQMSFLCVYFLIGFNYYIEEIKKLIIKKISNQLFFKNFIHSFILNLFINLILIEYHLSLHKFFNILTIFANILLIPFFYIIIIFNFLGICHKVFWYINTYFIHIILWILNICNSYGINIHFKLCKKYINYYGYITYLFLTIILLFLYKVNINRKNNKNLDIINCNENKYYF